MEKSFDIERVNQDEYAVRWAAEGQSGESVVRVTPDFLAEIGLDGFDQQAVVEETANFMAEHQPVIDFPLTVDLEEIAAAYEDYADKLRSRLQAG
ncbi:hypothetical protein ACIPY3_09635 [Paenarthrobacter sp. NPDC089714]|uniref:hypothetical protein n=1 Tax=Paenarthrobacter sp. NPDC089714 TaxID=3364377 RepID=UPI003829A411